MPGMVPDNDIKGHFRIILGHLASPMWGEIWKSLDIAVHSFAALGLAPEAPDRVVWQVCQKRAVILITGNRNDKGPDSLEATIRDSNAPASLPVFTLANVDRIRENPAYVDQVVERLLEALMDLDTIRGAGRIWLP